MRLWYLAWNLLVSLLIPLARQITLYLIPKPGLPIDERHSACHDCDREQQKEHSRSRTTGIILSALPDLP